MKREKDGGGGGGELMEDIGVDGRMDAERLREMQLSIAASTSVFPGFRFSPTDDELISYYLKKKLQGFDNCVDIIPEVDFCRHEPWDLPAISNIQSDNEWFFFSARGRKYPNGSQSRRATESGYWKATGKERNVKSGAATIGTKRTLVFHTGRAPRGERTEWIMHEYCMSGTSQDSLVICRLRKNSDFHLNESSRRGSSDHRSSLPMDNSNSGTDGYVDPQMGTFEGARAVESGSKEYTSSYTSHSVEQNDSGSESDQKLIKESPHGSSSQQTDWFMEDDCFADILNDDIIKLDESAPAAVATPSGMPVDRPQPDGETEGQMKSNQELLQETMSARPLTLQGTAVRRIRLRRQRGHRKSPLGRSRDAEQNQPPQRPSSWCVITFSACLVGTFVRHRFISLLLVTLVLALLVLFAACGGYHVAPCYEPLLHSCVAVPRRQLKFWLRKGTNYL